MRFINPRCTNGELEQRCRLSYCTDYIGTNTCDKVTVVQLSETEREG